MSYTPTNKPHAVRQAGTTSLDYGANGNVIPRIDSSGLSKSLSIDWNEDNKPATITTSTDTVTFACDGNSNRVKKETEDGALRYNRLLLITLNIERKHHMRAVGRKKQDL
jgi:YD repeat-containing protein